MSTSTKGKISNDSELTFTTFFHKASRSTFAGAKINLKLLLNTGDSDYTELRFSNTTQFVCFVKTKFDTT